MNIFMYATGTYHSRFRRQVLSGRLQNLYDCLLEGVLRQQKSIILQNPADVSDIRKTISAILDDYPEINFCDGTGMLEEKNTVCLDYQYSQDNENEFQLALASSKALIVRIKDIEPAEQIQYIHDWIIRNCIYQSGSDADHTIYGALLYGHACCQGFARLYVFLCNQLSIYCGVINGSTSKSKKDPDHAWNIVCMTGKTYYLDVTADLSGSEIRISRKYYLKSRNAMSVTHCNMTGCLSSDSDIPYFRSIHEVGKYIGTSLPEHRKIHIQMPYYKKPEEVILAIRYGIEAHTASLNNWIILYEGAGKYCIQVQS